MEVVHLGIIITNKVGFAIQKRQAAHKYVRKQLICNSVITLVFSEKNPRLLYQRSHEVKQYRMRRVDHGTCEGIQLQTPKLAHQFTDEIKSNFIS